VADPFAEKLAELRARFFAQLPARIADMERLIDQGDLPQIRALAHKMAGQGGTFGAPEVSAAAAAAEHAAPEELRHALELLAAAVRRSG